MMRGMATDTGTADTSGTYNEGFFTYYERCDPSPFWPDDDIISPLWDFIEVDQRKQNRANGNHKVQYRYKMPRMCNKLMSSRSGYRGVKELKRLNRS